MKESVAIAKEANRKQGSSPNKSDNSIQHLRNEPERQLGALRDVIGNIRRNGDTPSVESVATELSVMPSSNRASALLALQQTHGNRYVQRMVTGIQAKLKVGQPGDKYEQEADRVAEQVMQMPEPQVQRQVEPEEEEEEELIQAMQAEREFGEEEGARQISTTVAQLKRFIVGSPGDAYEREADHVADEVIQRATKDTLTELYRPEINAPSTTTLPPIQRVSNHPQPSTVDLNLNQSGGQPLERQVRRNMESRFGYDFKNVRVHTDARSHWLARSLNARAFTVGNTIVFNSGEYNPHSQRGFHLLAHELTHVLQQNPDRSPVVQQHVTGQEQVIQRNGGRWRWSSVQGSNTSANNRGVEIEDYAQRFVGLFMPARAMLSYSASADRYKNDTEADADFSHFQSFARFIAQGWRYRNASMSDARKWDLDPISGSITIGVPGRGSVAGNTPVRDGPLSVSARITRSTAQTVNENRKKLIVETETNINVGGSITETATASGGVRAMHLTGSSRVRGKRVSP